ncbi:MAG: hypothetical protein J6S96_10250 [Muribaculaceae bacterium]|nr:hypothetical protein [Muribaculaceae bacterium]
MSTIELIVLAVLLAVIGWAILYFKRKEKNDDLNPEKSEASEVQDYIAMHGEPGNVIIANPLINNELNGVILVYENNIVIGGQKVARTEVEDITFNNASVPYLNNQYQLVVTTRNESQPVVRMALGEDVNWASEVTTQLSDALRGLNQCAATD